MRRFAEVLADLVKNRYGTTGTPRSSKAASKRFGRSFAGCQKRDDDRCTSPSTASAASTRSRTSPRCIPEPGVLEEGGARVVDTNVNAFQHAWFNLRAAQRKFHGLAKWDAYFGKYDLAP